MRSARGSVDWKRRLSGAGNNSVSRQCDADGDQRGGRDEKRERDCDRGARSGDKRDCSARVRVCSADRGSQTKQPAVLCDGD